MSPVQDVQIEQALPLFVFRGKIIGRLPDPLARPKRHHAPRGDGDRFSGPGVAARARLFVKECEVTKARELHLFASGQSGADLVEKGLHQRFALPMSQAYLVYQIVRKVFFGDGHAVPFGLFSTNGNQRGAFSSIWPHQPDRIRAMNRRALSALQNTHGGTIPFPVLVLRLARLDRPVPLHPRRQDADPRLDGREIPLRRPQVPQFFAFHQNALVDRLIAEL